MKQQSKSLARLWSYLKAYRFSLFFAVFLKIVKRHYSVIRHCIGSLPSQESTRNITFMANGVAGAGINTGYIAKQFLVFLSLAWSFSMSWVLLTTQTTL